MVTTTAAKKANELCFCCNCVVFFSYWFLGMVFSLVGKCWQLL